MPNNPALERIPFARPTIRAQSIDPFDVPVDVPEVLHMSESHDEPARRSCMVGSSGPGDCAELERLREQIDRLDAELLDLLSARLELARQVGAAKASRNLAIVDRPREQQVLARALERCGSKLPAATISAVLETLIHTARAVQARSRVAHLGPAGTHSEAAARAFFPEGELISELTLAEVIAAVGTRAELAVVPWWNRHGGAVLEVHEAMREAGSRVRPLRWANLTVSHVLARRPGESFSTLLTRPEPLAGARSWIERELPGPLRIEHVASNAAAAEQAAGRAGTAAITTAAAAALHGLEIVARDIDGDDNVTTFAVIGPAEA